MCQKCPGVIEWVEDRNPGSSMRYGGPVNADSKPLRRKIMRPCTCHCNVNMQHLEEEGNRLYCPTCHHALSK